MHKCVILKYFYIYKFLYLYKIIYIYILSYLKYFLKTLALIFKNFIAGAN